MFKVIIARAAAVVGGAAHMKRANGAAAHSYLCAGSTIRSDTPCWYAMECTAEKATC